MSNKITLHVILSTLLLLPVAIILENSDGLGTVHSVIDYIREWIAPVGISSFISGTIFGVKRLLGKDSSFLNVYYHTAYSFAIITLLIVNIKYI